MLPGQRGVRPCSRETQVIFAAHGMRRLSTPRDFVRLLRSGVERENLLAENFRVDRAAFLKGERGSGRKLSQVRRWLSLAARQGAPPISSAHAALPNAEIIPSIGIVGMNDAKVACPAGAGQMR